MSPGLGKPDRTANAGWPGCLIASTLLALGSVMASVAPPDPAATLPMVAAEAPAWRELAAQFATQPDVTATFKECRLFPYRREPVVLTGEVRVSRERGLSLHYTEPEERVVVLDGRGMLVRDRHGENAGPADARASAANEAMLGILQFNLAELAGGYDIRGRREEDAWSLVLVPRSEPVRRAIGDILVDGAGATVRRIELRRSARQRIEIVMSAPRRAAFSPEELRRYFR